MQKLFYTCSIFFITSALYAQQPHCYTTEYQQQLIAEDPSYLQQKLATEARTAAIMKEKENYRITSDDNIYYIPVVVHVLYNNDPENISDDQIKSQIDVLNEDFRRLNEDASDTPSDFSDIAADTKIQFVLASIDPDGNTTTGITRTFTTRASFTTNDDMKYTSEDGEDAWPRSCYLNIWVCDLSGLVLGYASGAGTLGPADKDGVVIGYKWFGRLGTALYPYNLGRTTTHEIGHWLGLKHIWGDDGTSCGGSDGIADTPNQGSENYSCPVFPLTDACTPNPPGVMFMNYMDYTDDRCMNMFTQGQVNEMRSFMEDSRSDIIDCANTVDITNTDPSSAVYLNVNPNPTNGYFTITVKNPGKKYLQMEIFNSIGQVIQSTNEGNASEYTANINLSNQPNGVYVVRVSDGYTYFTKEFIISK